jgi:WD40 repeat protein
MLFRMRAIELSGAVVLMALAAGLARSEGLVPIWKERINSKTVNAPFPGSFTPSIWAVAFSSDSKLLAAGVGFVAPGTQPLDHYRSYVLIFSIVRPEKPLKILETRMKPWDLGPQMKWSPDGQQIGISSLRIDEPLYLIDVGTGAERTVPVDRCTLMGLMDGLQSVMGCFFGLRQNGPSIRVLDVDGAIDHDWKVPEGSVGARFAAASGLAGVALPDHDGSGDHHELLAIRAANGGEAVRWRFLDSWAFGGELSSSGSAFCTLVMDKTDWKMRKLVCRDNSTGDIAGRVSVEVGKRGSTYIGMAADRVTAEEWHWVQLPLPEPYKYAEASPGHRRIWDLSSGRTLARWPIPSQRLIPHGSKGNCPYALSPDGKFVGQGCSGLVTLDRVLP